jgi:hypothetical protein
MEIGPEDAGGDGAEQVVVVVSVEADVDEAEEVA